MESSEDWKSDFDREIIAANVARMENNEGKARVCARRAAGIAAGEFFRLRGIPYKTTSAYERLKMLEQMIDLPPEIHATVGYFLVRLTPEHKLPIAVNLISEAIWLRDRLMIISG